MNEPETPLCISCCERPATVPAQDVVRGRSTGEVLFCEDCHTGSYRGN